MSRAKRPGPAFDIAATVAANLTRNLEFCRRQLADSPTYGDAESVLRLSRAWCYGAMQIARDLLVSAPPALLAELEAQYESGDAQMKEWSRFVLAWSYPVGHPLW